MVANLSIDNMTLTNKRRIRVANGLTYDATTLQLHNLTARIRSLLHQHPIVTLAYPRKRASTRCGCPVQALGQDAIPGGST